MDKVIDVVFNKVANYFKYVMCVFAFISILGILIPTSVFGVSVGNYFSMNKNVLSGGPARAVFVIIFALAIIYIAVKKNELIPSIAAVVLALLVVIIADVGGMGAAKIMFTGGVRIIRWARVWLLITAIINAALIALKQFVIKNN